MKKKHFICSLGEETDMVYAFVSEMLLSCYQDNIAVCLFWWWGKYYNKRVCSGADGEIEVTV
jgi:hypothetical protein